MNIKRVGWLLVGVIMAAGIFLYALFNKEIKTLSTLSRVENTTLFSMEYRDDYGLDEFLEKGARTDAEVVEFVSKKLLKGLPLEFELPDFGCSTFAAQTPDGDYIFGRNFDFKPTPILVLKTYPESGYASVSTVDLDFLGYGNHNLPTDAGFLDKAVILASAYAPMDGINEKGLSIAVLQIFDEPTRQSTGKLGLTTSTAIRMVLDKAATVDEAINLLKQYDMNASAGSNYHFQLADASGNTAIVEYINNEMKILEQAQCATNFLLTPGQWNDKGEGYDRYDTLKATLGRTKNTLTEQEGMMLLKSVVLNDEGWPTQWSAVFNNTRKTINYCIHRDYKKTYSFSVR
ncbi:MAG: linear amide C-N hydrolase [Leadbetterella sp.]|nr:linear amide C-N hydrolase [Leadbetterella sp.]